MARCVYFPADSRRKKTQILAELSREQIISFQKKMMIFLFAEKKSAEICGLFCENLREIGLKGYCRKFGMIHV